MKNNYKYSPILKWRAAEITALNNVPKKDQTSLLPVLEIVLPTITPYKTEMKDGKKIRVRKSESEIHSDVVQRYRGRRLKEIPEEIEKSRNNLDTIVDFNLLHDGSDTVNLKIESIKTIGYVCHVKKLNIKPVVYLNDDQRIIKEISDQFNTGVFNGICIRVTVSDLERVKDLNLKLTNFIKQTGIQRSQIDMLIDIKYLDDKIKISYGRYFLNGQTIENMDKWRNVIFASGSFPVHVGHHKVENNPCVEQRLDWQLWLSAQKKIKQLRKYIFSDYTIRYPMHSEALQYMQSSATLKYTHNNNWIIYKGEKQKNEQYLTHAHFLVNSPFFYGEHFSEGDRRIKEKANYWETYAQLVKKNEKNRGKGTGATGYWISAGISHHIAVALSQLSSQT